MSTTTPNLGLVRPATGEQYDVGIVNGNNTTIDTAVGSLDTRVTALEGDINTCSGSAAYTITAGLSGAIAHGLGRIPKGVLFTQTSGGTFTPLTLCLDLASLDATNFKVRVKVSATGADFAGSVSFVWMAF